jgi:microcystin-dependent protein
MTTQLGLNDASRIIDVIDGRIQKLTRSGAKVETTWGTIASVSSDGKTAGAYLYGETDGAYISDGFRVPETSYVTIGDSVKVAIDYGTGDRWIAEIYPPATTYKKLALDTDNGQVLVGDGTAAPTPLMTGAPTYQTSNTSLSDGGKWTKIASGTIVSQYQNNFAVIEVSGNGSGGTSWTRGTIRFRVKQQAAFGNQPAVSVGVTDAVDFRPSGVAVVVTSVAGPTAYEVWLQIPDPYSHSYLTVINEEASGGGSQTWYELNGFQASLPAGTVYYGSADGDTPTGSILLWSTNTAPYGYLLCNGSAVSRTTYAALFNLIGTTYGAGDGSTTFNLPSLINRVPYGRNAEAIGSTGGATTHTHAGHSAHVFTQPSSHTIDAHTGGAVSAHSGTAVATHTGHKHEAPLSQNSGGIFWRSTPPFGTGGAHTPANYANTGTPSGSDNYSLTNTEETALSHSVTQPAAHTFTQPSNHAALSHSGGAVDGHSAHDSPSNMMPYIILNYIIKI